MSAGGAESAFLPCQWAKITTCTTAPIQPIPVPSQRFFHINVDLVGLCRSAQAATPML